MDELKLALSCKVYLATPKSDNIMSKALISFTRMLFGFISLWLIFYFKRCLNPSKHWYKTFIISISENDSFVSLYD